jgi:hypothetical protein
MGVIEVEDIKDIIVDVTEQIRSLLSTVYL